MWFLLLTGCFILPPAEVEGDDPGECTDRLDNDSDGLFDCFDDDCAGSPDCTTVGGNPGGLTGGATGGATGAATGGTPGGTTVSEDTCPDTGCGPAGGPCSSMTGFTVWAQFGYDANLQEFMTADVSGYPITAELITAWIDDANAINCYAYHDISSWEAQQDAVNGGVKFRGVVPDAYTHTCDLARFCDANSFGGYGPDTLLTGSDLHLEFGNEGAYFGDIEEGFGVPAENVFPGTWYWDGYEAYSNDWAVFSYAPVDGSPGMYDSYSYRSETQAYQAGLTTGAYFAYTLYYFAI